eukprot:6480145-Amphidinium_carterae.1
MAVTVSDKGRPLTRDALIAPVLGIRLLSRVQWKMVGRPHCGRVVTCLINSERHVSVESHVGHVWTGEVKHRIKGLTLLWTLRLCFSRDAMDGKALKQI